MPSRHRSRRRQQATLHTSQHTYPGFPLKVGGRKDRAAIGAVQHRLNQVGCGPVPENGTVDSETTAAVQLFQARSVDGQGRSLKPDGVVGPLTWTALFGSNSLPGAIDVPLSPLLKTTLAKLRDRAQSDQDAVSVLITDSLARSKQLLVLCSRGATLGHY